LTLLLIYYYMYGRQPKVILTNVLRTKIGRKYTQAQLKTGANFSDAGKLQSDQPLSSSAASLKIWQILNPTLQSLFLSKRQPKVILTNVLRTKIGRKYIDSHVIIDANLSDADKLQSGQLLSSSVASLQTCQILSSPHESSFLSERYSASCSICILLFSPLVVLSSDDEDGPSESKRTELLQDNVTDNKETDQRPDFCFSAKLLEGNMESHTEQVVQFLAYVLLCQLFNLFLQLALNKNIKLTVDTLDLRRFGLWRDYGGSSSTMIIFLWLSVDYVEKIEAQLGKLVTGKPSKSSEFVFLELSQPLTEWKEDRLTALITGVSKKNRAPDLSEVLSLKQALPLLKDLSPEESSFMSYSKDLLKQCMPKEGTLEAHEPAVQESRPKVARPSYALANKQSSGFYSISLSSALNEEWKEVREAGAVKNLIVYPPPPAKGGLGVTREDLECLEYGEFLNDVIIDFYLKYLLLEKAPKHLADRTHIFSSFFYKCLTRTEKNSEGDLKVSAAQRRHRRVRTWTRHINIFSKDYIFVPVNEESHWYIAVVCFPWLEEAMYEDCPHQNSLYHQPQESPLWSETSVVLVMKDYNNLFVFVVYRPCILILDSLKAGSVQKTVQVLREYLEVEWEAKRKTHREFNKSTMIDLCPRVPKQDNSSDCGVYLLQYVESFFQNPIVNFEQPLHLENWFPRQVIRTKREEIRDLILQLHFQQHSGSSS
uniref:SUMO specific peptidase 7 n=1 Tax=Strix occidentalis caurina TaxID=311401 RepID=A0A8D0EVD4_STROC